MTLSISEKLVYTNNAKKMVDPQELVKSFGPAKKSASDAAKVL